MTQFSTRSPRLPLHRITHFLLCGLVFLLSLFSSLSSLVVSSLLASSSRSISFMSCSWDFCLPTARSRVSNSARRSYNSNNNFVSLFVLFTLFIIFVIITFFTYIFFIIFALGMPGNSLLIKVPQNRKKIIITINNNLIHP